MEKTTQPRWWDLPAAALLMVAMITAATRLVVTDWTVNLGLVQTIVFFGTLSGLAIGQSRFSPKIAAFFAFCYGLFMVGWQLGRTLDDDLLWLERMRILLSRLELIIRQISRQDVVQDSLLFVVLMSVLFWLLSVHAGYTLTRYGHSWRAVLPAGLALFVIHSFDAMVARRAWYLAIYLFFALVLVARTSYLQQHVRWQESRTALPPHLGLDFIRFTLLATAIIVLFSWTVPALAQTLPSAERVFLQIKRPWDELRDKMDNAFASLRSNVGVVSDFYGDSMVLGRGNALTDTQMFAVLPQTDAPTSLRYYWRAKVYDTYLGTGGWKTTHPRPKSFNPEVDAVVVPADLGRFNGSFTFVPATSLSTLFTPSQPFWVSRRAEIEQIMNPDGTFDLVSFRALPPLRAGDPYKVQASVPNLTVAQLKITDQDYPQWVKDRYLQLPDTITARTRSLARQITAGASTPYDKVVAITNYLRRNIAYSQTVPEQPANQEAVDWFLFDLKSGFCNYYASAEVVMLRSIGIPARYATGYAQGELMEDGTYIVRQRDAHAWPEVFFSGVGWVEFEPTASQPAVTFLPGQEVTGAQLGTDALEEQRLREQAQELALQRERQGSLPGDASTAGSRNNALKNLVWILPALAGLSLLGAVVWRNRVRFNLPPLPVMVETSLQRVGVRPPASLRMWARRALLPPLSRSYLEINKALHRIGHGPQENATPLERAAELGLHLPPSSAPATLLVSEYQKATFSAASSEEVDVAGAQQAGMQIRKLSYQAWLRSFFRRWLSSLQRPDPRARLHRRT